ncbi:MAG: hypothetical protein M5U12_36085 [Verrucomicrobia bacterium]|nr:hypothetical protein [Verrucomicrobiota bacterium]
MNTGRNPSGLEVHTFGRQINIASPVSTTPDSARANHGLSSIVRNNGYSANRSPIRSFHVSPVTSQNQPGAAP